jgi:phosphoesterase RecJ-like protein
VKPPPELLELLRAPGDVLLATHIPMDGDGLGSGIALKRALEAQGRSVQFVTEQRVPGAFDFLPGSAEVIVLGPDDPMPSTGLLVGLDAGDEHRLGRAFVERADGCLVANIDHHATNDRYGDIAWVEPDVSSTGEMIHTLLRAMDAEITPEMAQALLVSLVTDTGRFSYSSTGPGTFEAAADLLRCGADTDSLYQQLFASRPLDVVRLRARAAEDLQLLAGGKVAVLTADREYGSNLEFSEDDLKDLIDVAIGLEGVVVAALVRGLPEGGTKVSLRSKSDRANVAALARKLGGGGHVRASGYSDDRAPADAAAALIPELAGLVE